MSVPVCPSVRYHVFCDYVPGDNKTAIPTGSSLNRLHLEKAIFVELLRSRFRRIVRGRMFQIFFSMAQLVIGERERANLVVRTARIFYLFIYDRTSSTCACSRIMRFFLSERISKFHVLPGCIIVRGRCPSWSKRVGKRTSCP